MRGSAPTTRILVVEDDPDFLESLSEMLRRSGYGVRGVGDGTSALREIQEADILVTDVRLPDISGIELLEKAREKRPSLQVIVMTGYGSIRDAVDVMRKGATTYLAKPFEPEELLLHLRQVEEVIRLRRMASRAGRGDLVGIGHAMQPVFAAIDAAAASQAPVLITGETGTGKELAARAIHQLSGRSGHPFLAVNLGALPKDLVESELFGHERGAFTGASRAKPGRFALAKGGTLLLDEVGTLPLDVQPKLLRAIETREFWPVGGERPVPFLARILAATNADLDQLAAEGSFRQDLFYRLDVLRVRMPPLREHVEDIPAIAAAILDRLGSEAPKGASPPELAPEALAALVTRPWPGNVRELQNALEKGWAGAVAARRAPPRIEAADLDLAPGREVLDVPFRDGRARAADEWGRKAIVAALAASEGNVTRAAELLRMNTSALFRLIKRYGLGGAKA
jgi:two-component system, NtrC family, response regulator AtoC